MARRQFDGDVYSAALHLSNLYKRRARAVAQERRRAAVARISTELRCGGLPEAGRNEIRALLQRQTRGGPSLLVSTDARWTLNAFSAGYARGISKEGRVKEDATANEYRVLMEGLETFAAGLNTRMDDDLDRPNYAYTADGRRYISALPRDRTEPREDKNFWLSRSRPIR
jgi:hypothetical protein